MTAIEELYRPWTDYDGKDWAAEQLGLPAQREARA